MVARSGEPSEPLTPPTERRDGSKSVPLEACRVVRKAFQCTDCCEFSCLRLVYQGVVGATSASTKALTIVSTSIRIRIRLKKKITSSRDHALTMPNIHLSVLIEKNTLQEIVTHCSWLLRCDELSYSYKFFWRELSDDFIRTNSFDRDNHPA